MKGLFRGALKYDDALKRRCLEWCILGHSLFMVCLSLSQT